MSGAQYNRTTSAARRSPVHQPAPHRAFPSPWEWIPTLVLFSLKLCIAVSWIKLILFPHRSDVAVLYLCQVSFTPAEGRGASLSMFVVSVSVFHHLPCYKRLNVVDHQSTAMPQGMVKIVPPKSLYSASLLFNCNWLFYKYNTPGKVPISAFRRSPAGHMVWYDRIPLCYGSTNIKIIFFTGSTFSLQVVNSLSKTNQKVLVFRASLEVKGALWWTTEALHQGRSVRGEFIIIENTDIWCC